MRVIIAGSRTITDYERVERAIKASGWSITEVVSGTAQGVDILGELWGDTHQIPVKQFRANWNDHGKAAGPIRNAAMARYAAARLPDAGLILVWDGRSKGSANMRLTALRTGLSVFEDRAGRYHLEPAHIQAELIGVSAG